MRKARASQKPGERPQYTGDGRFHSYPYLVAQGMAKQLAEVAKTVQAEVDFRLKISRGTRRMVSMNRQSQPKSRRR